MSKISRVPVVIQSRSESQSDHAPTSWSTRRASHSADEKRQMARYFAEHDFLVRAGSSPATDGRATVASVLVGQGTTPNVVVEEALAWISANSTNTSYDITWFTAGSLVPATLRDFRFRHVAYTPAAQLFLFPGRVDHEIEAVSGPEPVEFAAKLNRRFSYAFLSAHSFDVASGSFYFHYSSEIQLQRALASLHAAHKFVFLDPSKFTPEGEYGYGVHELLQSSYAVTIYTVSSAKDSYIRDGFERLAQSVISSEADSERHERKKLRLIVVGADGPTDHLLFEGVLRRPDS